MRPTIFILIGVAIILGLITALLANKVLKERDIATLQANSHTQPLAAIQVLVAATDIPAGNSIGGNDLKWQTWPADKAIDAYITRPVPQDGQTQQGEDPRALLIGKISRRALVAGEPLGRLAAFHPNETGMLAGMLAPGMRAVSLNVTPANGISGFALPGDRVDVLLTADFVNLTESRPDPRTGLVRYATETVIKDARVLAVDQRFQRPSDNSPILGKTVTLELSPSDAEKMIAAGMMGSLSLSLRSFARGENSDSQQPAFSTDMQSSQILQMLKNNAPSSAPKGNATSPSGGEVKINRAGTITLQEVVR